MNGLLPGARGSSSGLFKQRVHRILGNNEIMLHGKALLIAASRSRGVATSAAATRLLPVLAVPKVAERGSAGTPSRSWPPQGKKMSSERRDLSTSCNGSSKFRLTLDTINPYVKDMEYAVRGKMPQEASKIEKAIQKVSKPL